MRGNGASIEELQAVFRDRPELCFRHFPDATVEMLRWQAGRNALHRSGSERRLLV